MEEENEEKSSVLHDDYYAFLNIPKDASVEEITNAYRRLSRSYHPDKHVDPLHKKDAEMIFNKIKKAYEVLRDPHKRAIYDSVGVKGLETDGWEIIKRTKTPGEIREEYERLARQREERRLLQRTNPKGNVVVNINAMELFSRYDSEYEYDVDDNLPTIEVSGMSMTQSIEAPLTLRDTSTITAHVNIHNGVGSGNFNLTNKRQLSDKSWIEVFLGGGSGPVLGLKGFRTLGKRAFCQAESFVQFRNAELGSGLDTTVAMQLEKSTMGYLTYRAGSSSSMSTSIVRNTENTNTNFTLLFGIPHSYISLGFTFKASEIKLKSSIKAGTFGTVLEYGAEKKVSEQSTVSASVSVGTVTGVVLRLRFTRASQSYLFPIQLCDEILASPVFYATVAPVLSFLIVKKLLVDPITNEANETKRQRERETYKKRIAEKRREAQAATSLMAVTFARIRAEEEARKGLVIVSAEYGKNADLKENRDEVIDVTIPLQCLVKDSKLVIYDSTKSQLPGFYDPCVGEDKSLNVQYLFHNRLHQTTIADDEPLRIPRQSHRVNPT